MSKSYTERESYKAIQTQGGRVASEHVLVAERALGRRLPDGAQVHHINKNRRDNRPQNLVICQDQDYHRLLHSRLDAFEATGNPNLRRCHLCGQFDEPTNLYRVSRHQAHRRCMNDYQNRRAMAARRRSVPPELAHLTGTALRSAKIKLGLIHRPYGKRENAN